MKVPTPSMAKLVGTVPGATVTISPLSPTLKLATLKGLSTSRSLVSTLPEEFAASSMILIVSAVKTDTSSTAVTLIVNL